MDAIIEFADLITVLRFDDLPAPAVEAVKKDVLDSLATALGGSRRDGIKEMVDMVGEWGGREQSTVIAYGGKYPAPSAALVNGAMVHALDYDDGHPVAQVHIGCVVVPTGFAAGERTGGVSGGEFIVALALGSDFMARLGLASLPHGSLIRSGWHPTAIYGYFGAAAVAARIFHLDKERVVNALGIVYHQSAGNSQCVEDGAMTKRIGPGLAARGGLTAALMAERGITGAQRVLEGQYGVFNQYMKGDYDRNILTDGLGEKFEGENIGQKPYPCCGFSHPFIDAVLSLKSKYGIVSERISSITAYGGEAAYEICEPLDIKRNPRNNIDAQFSVPWAIATAMVKGRVSPEHFTLEAIKDKAVLRISNKVTGVLEPSMNRHGVGPGRVEIKLDDGAVYVEEVEHFLGSVENPMTFEDCARKFRECAAISIKPLPDEQIERVIGMVDGLEQLDDATEIIRLLG